MQTVGQAVDAGYRWIRLYWTVPGTSSFALSKSLDAEPAETDLIEWAQTIHSEKPHGDLIEISVVAPDRIEDPDPERFELSLWHVLRE